MRRTLLAVALTAFGVASLGGLAIRPQVIDGNACTDSCYRQKAACVSECGTHSNPIECEADCREQLQDCIDTCQ